MRFLGIKTNLQTGPVGIDIRGSGITAVQLAKSGISGGFGVVGRSKISLPSGAIINGRINKSHLVKNSIEELLSKPSSGFFRGNRVVLSIPEHEWHHRVFYDQHKSGLDHHLAKYPDNMITKGEVVLNDLTHDYFYISAIDQELVNEFRDTFKHTGATSVEFEPRLLSAARFVFPGASISEPVLFVDINNKQTTIGLLDQLGVHRTAVLDIGTDTFLSQLARNLMVYPDEANEVLYSLGLRKVRHRKTPVVHSSLRPSIEKIVSEAQDQVRAYKRWHPENQYLSNALLVCGQGARVPGLAEALSHSLKSDLRPGQSWANFQPGFTTQELGDYDKALGAALFAN